MAKTIAPARRYSGNDLVHRVRASAQLEADELAIQRFGQPTDDFEAQARRWTEDKAALALRYAQGRPRAPLEGFVASSETPLNRLLVAFAHKSGCWFWRGRPSNRDLALLAILAGVRSEKWRSELTVAEAIEHMVEAVKSKRRRLATPNGHEGPVDGSVWTAPAGKRGRPRKRQS